MTIAGETLPAAAAVPRARDAEPDRVRGHLPAARGAGRPLPVQADRRLPDGRRGGRRRRPRDLARRSQVREQLCRSPTLERYQELARRVFVDRDVIAYAVALADATRHPGKYGLHELDGLIEFGASPRGPIGTGPGRPGARAAARPQPRGRRGRRRPRRGRAAPPPRAHLRRARRRRAAPTTCSTASSTPSAACAPPPPRGPRAHRRMSTLARRPARAPGPGPDAGARSSRRSTSCSPAAPPGRCRASAARPAAATGTELAQVRPVPVRRRRPQASTPRPAPAPASPTCATTCPSARSPRGCSSTSRASMAFGTADRLKSDVAEGVALVIGRLAVRRAGRIALLTCGAAEPQQLPPRGGRAGARRAAQGARRGRRRRRPRRREDALADGMRRDRAARPRPQPRRGRVRLPRGRSDGVRRRARGPSGRARSPASPRATTCSPSRSSTRARPSCPTSGHLVLVDPETGSASRPTRPAPSCGGGSPRPSSRAATSSSPTCARARARHVEVAHRHDWLRALGRSLR